MAKAKTKTPKVKIGDRFGKLVALEQIEMDITKKVLGDDGNYHKMPTGRTKVGWECQCDCGRKAKIPEITLLKETSALRSCGKCPPVKNENFVPVSMSFEESEEWNELYEYVRSNIMGYDKDTSLSSRMVARLQGLMKGKYMVSYKTADNADYSYKTILNTFKYCSPDIRKALSYKSFDDEWIKFNYIAKIVENNINTVYKREQQAEKNREKTKNLTIDSLEYTGATYQKKTKEISNSLLDGLW